MEVVLEEGVAKVRADPRSMFQSYFSWKSFWKKKSVLSQFRNSFGFNPTFRGSRSGSPVFKLRSILAKGFNPTFRGSRSGRQFELSLTDSEQEFQSYFSWKSFWKLLDGSG